MNAREIQEALAAPFAVEDVKFLPQVVKGSRALAVAYVDARTVMDRLDDVLGVNGWADAYEVMNDGAVMCRLSALIEGVWVTKCDTGSESEQSSAGDRVKAAFSDALKRTAVKLGVGRYLYRLPPTWEDYDPQSKKITSFPAWAKRGRQSRAAAEPAQEVPGEDVRRAALKYIQEAPTLGHLDVALGKAKKLFPAAQMQEIEAAGLTRRAELAGMRAPAANGRAPQPELEENPTVAQEPEF